MTPEELLSILDNPNFISGIYNYCDRWCERCRLSSRCSLFATEKIQDEEYPPGEDGENQFLKRVHDNFQLTFQLIEKFSKEEGIDLTIDEESTNNALEERKARKEAAREAEPVLLAQKYIDLGKAWMDTSETILIEKEADLNTAAQLGLPSRDPEKEVADIMDALEVIRFYLFQIYVKLTRAYGGKDDDYSWDEENEFPRDYDVSAKIALMGIDNSIDAWRRVLHHFIDEADDIYEVLGVLQKLQRWTETDFPNARGIRRPGFDDLT